MKFRDIVKVTDSLTALLQFFNEEKESWYDNGISAWNANYDLYMSIKTLSKIKGEEFYLLEAPHNRHGEDGSTVEVVHIANSELNVRVPTYLLESTGRSKMMVGDKLRTFLSEGGSTSVQLLETIEKCDPTGADAYFIDLSSDSMGLSYLTKDRILSGDFGSYGGCFSNERRNKMAYKAKPVRLLNRLFKSNGLDPMSQKEIDVLMGLFAVDKNFRFEIVEGEDIKKYYSVDNYYREDGTLGASCMKYDDCQRYFSLYEENAKMVVLINRDKDVIRGRAILWEGVKFKGGEVTFMDRIYTCDHNDIFAFKKFAEDNGWLSKEYQSFDEHEVVERADGDSIGSAEDFEPIVCQSESYNYYPYMDTFKSFKDGELTCEKLDGACILESTDGDYYSVELCNYCGGIVDDENYTDDGIVCYDCFNSDYTWSEIHDEYIQRESSITCASCCNRMYEHSANIMSNRDYEHAVCDYCETNNYSHCEVCGEDVLNRDFGTDMCNNCENEAGECRED